MTLSWYVMKKKLRPFKKTSRADKLGKKNMGWKTEIGSRVKKGKKEDPKQRTLDAWWWVMPGRT